MFRKRRRIGAGQTSEATWVRATRPTICRNVTNLRRNLGVRFHLLSTGYIKMSPSTVPRRPESVRKIGPEPQYRHPQGRHINQIRHYQHGWTQHQGIAIIIRDKCPLFRKPLRSHTSSCFAGSILGISPVSWNESGVVSCNLSEDRIEGILGARADLRA